MPYLAARTRSSSPAHAGSPSSSASTLIEIPSKSSKTLSPSTPPQKQQQLFSSTHFSNPRQTCVPSLVLAYFQKNVDELETSAKLAGVQGWVIATDVTMGGKTVWNPDRPYERMGLIVYGPSSSRKKITKWCVTLAQKTAFNFWIGSSPPSSFSASTTLPALSSHSTLPSLSSLSMYSAIRKEAEADADGNGNETEDRTGECECTPDKDFNSEQEDRDEGDNRDERNSESEENCEGEGSGKLRADKGKAREGEERDVVYKGRYEVKKGRQLLLRSTLEVRFSANPQLKSDQDATKSKLYIGLYAQGYNYDAVGQDFLRGKLLRVDLVVTPRSMSGWIAPLECDLEVKEPGITKTTTKPTDLGVALGAPIGPHSIPTLTLTKPPTTQAVALIAPVAEKHWEMSQQNQFAPSAVGIFTPSTAHPYSSRRAAERGLQSEITTVLDDPVKKAPATISLVIYEEVSTDTSRFSVHNYVSVSFNSLDIVDLHDLDSPGGSTDIGATYDVLSMASNSLTVASSTPSTGAGAVSGVGTTLSRIYIEPRQPSLLYRFSRKLWNVLTSGICPGREQAALPRVIVDNSQDISVQVHHLTFGQSEITSSTSMAAQTLRHRLPPVGVEQQQWPEVRFC